MVLIKIVLNRKRKKLPPCKVEQILKPRLLSLWLSPRLTGWLFRNTMQWTERTTTKPVLLYVLPNGRAGLNYADHAAPFDAHAYNIQHVFTLITVNWLLVGWANLKFGSVFTSSQLRVSLKQWIQNHECARGLKSSGCRSHSFFHTSFFRLWCQLTHSTV